MIIEKLLSGEILTDTEKSIASFLLDEDIDIRSITCSELGQKTYTSQSAVTRLCRKVGAKNYREFMSILFEEKKQYYNSYKDYTKNIGEYFNSLESINLALLEMYQNAVTMDHFLIDEHILNRLVNRIISNNAVDIYANGISNTVAKQLEFKLRSLGIYATAFNGVNYEYLRTMPKKDQSVSIIISLTDKNPEMYSLAMTFKENGFYFANITQKTNNGISSLIEDNLFFKETVTEDGKVIFNLFNIEHITNILYANILFKKRKAK